MEETLPRPIARGTVGDRQSDAGVMGSLLDTVPCDICGGTRSTLEFRKRETRPWWIAKCADDPRLDRDYAFTVRLRHDHFDRFTRALSYHEYASGASPPGPGKISSSFFIVASSSLISSARRDPTR